MLRNQILVALCVILSLYQSRLLILQFIDIFLQVFLVFTTEAHEYIQQQIKYSQDLKFCNQRNNKYNLSQYAHQCPQHQYNIRVIERRPMIIYIEEFLTPDEIQHFIELSTSAFVKSGVTQASGGSTVDEDYRSSRTAHLGRSRTPVVKCIEQRFAQFQGDIDPLRIEPLQVVKYEPNQEFKPHTDWFHDEEQKKNGGQRVSTFFTYLYANCSKGETEFINVQFNSELHSRFCKFLICDELAPYHGLRFRPIPGNSIFWFNINENGVVDNTTFHAGRPPGETGLKLGLNTWTRETEFVWQNN